MDTCCNTCRRGIFGGYEEFWIILILAVVIVWVLYWNNSCRCGTCGCGNVMGTNNCNNGCGCGC